MSVTYIHTYLKLLEGEEAFVEGEDGWVSVTCQLHTYIHT